MRKVDDGEAGDAANWGGRREVKRGDEGYIFTSEKDSIGSVVQALLLKCGRGKDLSWWDGKGDDGATMGTPSSIQEVERMWL